ncbi:MAG: hypothetical protein Ct9H300mP1_31240 [Planctomycetaceae bacterium]|nr:MAG: hypothetical protein Ct9H300mP1_31240 [Planctomycetaceae bacterium]
MPRLRRCWRRAPFHAGREIGDRHLPGSESCVKYGMSYFSAVAKSGSNFGGVDEAKETFADPVTEKILEVEWKTWSFRACLRHGRGEKTARRASKRPWRPADAFSSRCGFLQRVAVRRPHHRRSRALSKGRPSSAVFAAALAWMSLRGLLNVFAYGSLVTVPAVLPGSHPHDRFRVAVSPGAIFACCRIRRLNVFLASAL